MWSRRWERFPDCSPKRKAWPEVARATATAALCRSWLGRRAKQALRPGIAAPGTRSKVRFLYLPTKCGFPSRFLKAGQFFVAGALGEIIYRIIRRESSTDQTILEILGRKSRSDVRRDFTISRRYAACHKPGKAAISRCASTYSSEPFEFVAIALVKQSRAAVMFLLRRCDIPA